MYHVAEKAKEMLQWLEKREKKAYQKQGSPQWVTDVIRECHEKLMPNDGVYYIVYQALLVLSESNSLDEALDNVEPDVYINDLLWWMDNDPYAISYIDEARKEFGVGESVVDDISNGQYLRIKRMVMMLADKLSEIEEEEEAGE